MAGRGKKGKYGVHLYESENRKSTEQSGGRGLLLFLVRSILVWFLAVAWQRGFLSVFPIPVNEKWMYGFLFLFALLGSLWALGRLRYRIISLLICAALAGGVFWRKQVLAAAMMNSVANAYLRVHQEGTASLQLYQEPVTAGWVLAFLLAFAMVPFVLLWSYVIAKNKGRVLAFVLILFPGVLAAVEGYFISIASCWLLFFAAGLYFAVCGGTSGKAAVKSSVSACLCLLILFLAGSAAVKPIESGKTSSRAYHSARKLVSENVVSKLADLADKSKEDKKEKDEDQKKQADQEKKDQEKKDQERQDEQNAKDEKKAEQEDTKKEDEARQSESDDLPSSSDFDGPSGEDGSLPAGADNLKSLAYFSPGDGNKITVTVKEKPKGTYYYPEVYGGSYDGDSWDPKPLGDEVYPQYSEYPKDLDRLISLCNSQKVSSIEDAARFIQQEFEKQAVYDYHPGPTPKDQDFAEYFLFENKKGFCVHFATTATLMYRIFGYQARYAQGFAIPASAFEKQADGTYIAQVTGEMGHAWCETYEDGWTIREHTLPYTGEVTTVVPPAQDSRQNPPLKRTLAEKTFTGILAVAAVLVVCSGILFLQSAGRRRKRYLKCRKYRKGRGILELNQYLYDIAVFLGMQSGDPSSAKTLQSMQELITEITAEDWTWIQQMVWQTLFGPQPPSKEEHERLFRLVLDTAEEIGRGQSRLGHFKYRYIKSLG